MLSYAQDYDERNVIDRMPTALPATPTGPYATSWCGNVFFWKDHLNPYIKNQQIWICPSDKADGTTCVVAVRRSYQPNTEMVPATGVKLAQVDDPAGTIHLMESNYNSRVHFTDPGSYKMPGNPSNWHNDGWNISFVDGHAKWFKDVKNGMFTLVSGD